MPHPPVDLNRRAYEPRSRIGPHMRVPNPRWSMPRQGSKQGRFQGSVDPRMNCGGGSERHDKRRRGHVCSEIRPENG